MMREYTLDELSPRFYLASLYVEELKYRGGDGTLTAVKRDDLIDQAATLLTDAQGRPDEAKGLVHSCAWVGQSFANAVGVPPVWAESLILDGVLHGIAYAARLEGPSRDKRKVSLDL